jgi:hypothetical protein
MTDDEFERLKAAEKEHLREKKKLRKQLAALKKRHRAQGLVQTMKQGAERLLRETESLVDTLRRQVASSEAKLEVAAEADDRVDDLHEAEEALREERAESLVRQYKAATGDVSSSSGTETSEKSDASASDSTSKPDGPEKTIGRMRTPRPDDASGSAD